MESKHNNPNCDECVRRDTSNSWSDLPSDLLISVFECLGFTDFQRAKSVCSSWHCASKQSVPKNQIPWLILFPENSNYCRLFNPEEKDRLYQTKDLGFEFAKCDCIATYGNWLLMRDPGSYFYIVNLFTQERINLPPVESQIGMTKIERTLDNHFRISNDLLITPMYWRCLFTSSPVFWIDDTTKDYIVLWGLAGCCVVYSKKGDNFWNQIPESATYFDIVYKDHKLYISSCRNIFRIIDFSGEIPQETFQCYLYVHRFDKRHRFYDNKIVVTVSGDVLKVRKAWRSGFRIFKIYDSSSGLLKKSEKVESLGNEVIILDLGIILANQLEEFNTNAIYFNGNYIKNPNTTFLFKLDTKKFERLDKFECSPVQFSRAQCFLPSFKQT